LIAKLQLLVIIKQIYKNTVYSTR